MPDNLDNIRRIASFPWNVARDLHGVVVKSENQNIILPLVVLRLLDNALAPTKAKVVETEAKLKAKGLENRHDALCRAAGFSFYNTNPNPLNDLLDDDANQARRLKSKPASPSSARSAPPSSPPQWRGRLKQSNLHTPL